MYKYPSHYPDDELKALLISLNDSGLICDRIAVLMGVTGVAIDYHAKRFGIKLKRKKDFKDAAYNLDT